MSINVPQSVFDKYFGVIDSTFDIFGVTCQLVSIEKREIIIDDPDDNLPIINTINDHRRNGGGDKKRNISPNIVKAVDYAKKIGMEIYGILGMPNGHTATNGDIVIVVPSIDSKFITPQSEAFQAVVWHCLVSHPALQTKPTKW